LGLSSGNTSYNTTSHLRLGRTRIRQIAGLSFSQDRDMTLMTERRSTGFVVTSGTPMPNEIRADAVVHDQKQAQARNISGFNYSAPAELFPSRIKKSRTKTRYMRFDTAAEAVRFAVEDIAPPALLGAYLEVDEARFGVQEIRFLYDSVGYPLKRATPQN